MRDCQDCGACSKGGRLTWRQLLASMAAAFLGVVLLFIIFRLGAAAHEDDPVCLTREEVAEAAEKQGKCLTIYGDGVYDFTTAKKWDLTGHVGKHACGKEYDKETIEKGPHPSSVINAFYYTKLCGTVAAPIKSEEGFPKKIFGMSWLSFSAYLSLVFFVLNFATCYAMPWAKVKEPWRGELPGPDQADTLGRFPLTHWHKIWAWLAIFTLSFHGLLGFSGMLLGKWY